MSALTLILAMSPLLAPDRFDDRQNDWRIGPIVYQVIVDRFAPPADLESKKQWIQAPRMLHPWTDVPRAGKLDPTVGMWSHELDFWGGDLASLTGKLDYVQNLGADVLYLTPIFQAISNHKYDTQDYFQIDPAYGNQDDLNRLTQNLHQRGMKLMLDGVFNHIGKASPLFQAALNNDRSPYRNWFTFGSDYANGYRGWSGSSNLPTLKLENPAVRDYLWRGRNSVVQKYLRAGIDGWRLDVAFEIGPTFLDELTRYAHAAKPGSDVVGEVSGYPADWFPALDGVFDFSALAVGREMLQGNLSGGRAGAILDHMVEDAGIDHLLRSWLLLDNHDTPRLADAVPSEDDRKVLMALQMTLPGSPVLYYGTELGMTGKGDPEDRAPMRWDLVNDTNETLRWEHTLINLRKTHPALRYGDFTALDTNALLGFVRTTDKLRDTAIVLVNPTDAPVHEVLATRVGRIMSWGGLRDELSKDQFRSINGMLTVDVPAKTMRVLTPMTESTNGASPYTRIP